MAEPKMMTITTRKAVTTYRDKAGKVIPNPNEAKKVATKPVVVKRVGKKKRSD